MSDRPGSGPEPQYGERPPSDGSQSQGILIGVLGTISVLAVLALIGVVVFGLNADDEDATGESRPSPTGTPVRVDGEGVGNGSGPGPFLVSHGSTISRYRDGRLEEFASLDGTAEIAADAGPSGVVVEEKFGSDPEESHLVLVDEGERTTIETPEAASRNLFDTAVIDGEAHLLYGTYTRSEFGEPEGWVYLQGLRSGRRTQITSAADVEFTVYHASYGGGVIVTSALADLTETFGFFRPDGTDVSGRPNPTEDLEYGAPPYMAHAVLDPTGETLAYLEGPEAAQEGEVVGDWELVLLDQEEGRETLRMQVASRDDRITWLDFDGRWVVLSRREDAPPGEPGDPLPTRLVDTRDEEPEVRDLPDVLGKTTIADVGGGGG